MKQIDLQGNIYDCQIEQNHSVIATKFYSLEKQIELKDKEIKRLNNIINELEKWLEDRKEHFDVYEPYGTPTGIPNYSETRILANVKELYDILQKLKRGDKE